MMTSHLSSYVYGGCWFISGSSSRIQHSCEDSARMAQTCVCLCSDQCSPGSVLRFAVVDKTHVTSVTRRLWDTTTRTSVSGRQRLWPVTARKLQLHQVQSTLTDHQWPDETQTMFHIVESCPLTKLNGGLSRLRSVDEDSVSWLTSYGSCHAYKKKK